MKDHSQFSSVPLRAVKLTACLVFLSVAGWSGATATDADKDGIPASWESTYGLSDSDPTDASLDPDGDFLTNLGEYLTGTDPAVADTDGDGLSDLYSYGMEGYWRFSETAGTPSSTANEVAGGPALTLNGATIVTEGLFGNALKPVYYSNNVNAAAVVLSGAMEWSFSGWFRMDTVNTNNVIFAAKASSSSTTIIGAHLSGSS